MKSIRLTAAFALALFQHMALAGETAQTTRAKVGEKAPDFTCHTLSGESFSLGKEKGKVVLVNFFATGVDHVWPSCPISKKKFLRNTGTGRTSV